MELNVRQTNMWTDLTMTFKLKLMDFEFFVTFDTCVHSVTLSVSLLEVVDEVLLCG